MKRSWASKFLGFILYFQMAISVLGAIATTAGLVMLMMKFPERLSSVDILSFVSVAITMVLLFLIAKRCLEIRKNIQLDGFILGLTKGDSLQKLIKLMWGVFIVSIALYFCEQNSHLSLLATQPIDENGFKATSSFRKMGIFSLNLGGLNGLVLIALLSLIKNIAGEGDTLKKETEGLV